MTPKEKAKELIAKFENFNYDDGYDYYTSSISYIEAKQCALIAVDEILALLPEIAFGANVYEYWQQVRKEIESL